MKRKKMTVCAVQFECIKPGLWRSVCGWYEVCRCGYSGYWEFDDLSEPKKKQKVYGDSMRYAVFHGIYGYGEEAREKFRIAKEKK